MQKIRLLNVNKIIYFRKYIAITCLIYIVLSFRLYAQHAFSECKGRYSSEWTECVGVYTTPTGNYYAGEFRAGKKSGKGMLLFKENSTYSGDKYVGEWRDDKPNGFGIYYFINGNRYEGEFKDGKRHGTGAYFKNNGILGIGEWKNNKPHGEFSEYSSFNLLINSGIFEDGVLLKKQLVDAETRVSFLRKNLKSLIDLMQSNPMTFIAYSDNFNQFIKNNDNKDNNNIINSKTFDQSIELIKSAIADKPEADGAVNIKIELSKKINNLKINGQSVDGIIDDKFIIKRYAKIGIENLYIIEAFDAYGNSSKKIISVFREPELGDSVNVVKLDPLKAKYKHNKDAVAIIIGIEKYKRITRADYANADAQVFYDYAIRALGIAPENIKLLVDERADDAEIYRAFQNWLPLKVKKTKTDVFVFFSGHGLPSQDGKSLFLLPWGVDKDFVDKTAISSTEIIASLQAVQPKSVFMFLDSCYSGQAKSGETLLASARPIALKIDANIYPPNFTVFSASALDQLSSSSAELKHGIFSFYLMKGMEGDADLNRDNQITFGEMQEYLTEMVGRQAMGMNRKQQPQLFGDAERILIGK